MGKIEKEFVTKKVENYCVALWHTVKDFNAEWLGFEDAQYCINDTVECVWNEAIEVAAQEADTNGDFATSNAIRTYKIKDMEILYE